MTLALGRDMQHTLGPADSARQEGDHQAKAAEGPVPVPTIETLISPWDLLRTMRGGGWAGAGKGDETHRSPSIIIFLVCPGGPVGMSHRTWQGCATEHAGPNRPP